MPLLALSVIIQATLIIHCVRTGRNTLWIWVLALLPLAGPLAYVAVEIIPELLGGRTARRAVQTVRKTFDPTRDLRDAHKQLRLTGSIDARRRFAEELLASGHYDEAIENFRAAMTGIYEHDPVLMLDLARAQFAKGDAAAARTTLDALIEHNPDFRSPDGHLLYARALEGEGNFDKAASEYEELVRYYPGAEAKYRYASLLKRIGKDARAHAAFHDLVDTFELATKHYRKTQKEWLELAKKEFTPQH